MDKEQDDLFLVEVLLVLGAFIFGWAVICNNFDIEQNKICEKLNPTNYPISNLIGQICIYSNLEDFREIEYDQKRFYLIDNNRLGKQVVE